jgi:HAE1 family hydrophobic/amphiphilic exporter-1
MPREMGYDYMGMSYQEQQARQGIPASVIFGFSLLFVFLIFSRHSTKAGHYLSACC